MSSSFGIACENVLAIGQSTLDATLSKSQRKELEQLAKLGNTLIEFVYGYSLYSTDPGYVDNPSWDSDDEILNWTLVDVAGDLSASVWLLASGFYKAAGSNMRNALDLSFAGLYFQVQVFDEPSKSCYDLDFGRWDRGEIDTPSWKKITPILKARPAVHLFNSHHSCDVLEEVREQFRKLCGFTHSRAWEKSSKVPSNIMWMGDAQPSFDVDLLNRFCTIYRETVSAIASAWLVSFPHIIKKRPLGPNKSAYVSLFHGIRGTQVLDFYW